MTDETRQRRLGENEADNVRRELIDGKIIAVDRLEIFPWKLLLLELMS